MLSFGFPPISSPSARILILGSLPGRVSLERGEYYANPQNSFWKILAARVPDLAADYAGRVRARFGSSASTAGPRRSSMSVMFCRRLTDEQRAIARQTLSSTSGAHAGLTFAQKAERWSIAFDAPKVSVSTSDACVYKPDGWPTAIPRIIVRDTPGLIAFMKRVFGAEGDFHPGRPAEIKIGDSMIMVSDGGGIRDAMPTFLYVYVEDVDATFSRALAQGATSVEATAEMPYGDRRAMVQDPFGNTWQIATRLHA